MRKDDYLGETMNSMNFIIDQVIQSGWYDKSSTIDNFSLLRRDRHTKDALIYSLYEEYFLPERHEHEWKLLSDIINSVIDSKVLNLAGGAIAGGVVGNAAYDLLKKLCKYASDIIKEKIGSPANERANSFQKIANDLEIIQTFFQSKSKARILEIEEATGLPREKIYPLMKIAGLTHYRRGEKTCYWEIPQ